MALPSSPVLTPAPPQLHLSSCPPCDLSPPIPVSRSLYTKGKQTRPDQHSWSNMETSLQMIHKCIKHTHTCVCKHTYTHTRTHNPLSPLPSEQHLRVHYPGGQRETRSEAGVFLSSMCFLFCLVVSCNRDMTWIVGIPAP